jgi:hypothetical protein
MPLAGATPWRKSELSSRAFGFEPAQKPAQVSIEEITHVLRLGNAVTLARVHDVLHWYVVIDERLVDLSVVVYVQ